MKNMILSEKLIEELVNLDNDINIITNNANSITQSQLETFLKNMEKRRYGILTQVNLYNKTVEYNTEKIKTNNENYKAELKNNVLKVYVPEVMPSYKNLKTHAYKNILLNIADVTNKYSDLFKNEVFVYIKIFDNIKNWDIDNKFIKPIFDSLIASKVIKDDNITKTFYSVKGEFSETPHTEVYIFEATKVKEFMEDIIS